MQTTVSREQTKNYNFGPKPAQQQNAMQQSVSQPANPQGYSPQAVRPLKSFRTGALSVSIWENEILGEDGQPRSYKTVSFERRYKDPKSGEWKSSNSLRVNDLPKATLILQKAYEYLILTETETHDEAY